jgi:hypothetical protein
VTREQMAVLSILAGIAVLIRAEIWLLRRKRKKRAKEDREIVWNSHKDWDGKLRGRYGKRKIM